MNKRLDVPRSRLVCFGSARALTNAVYQRPIEEDDPEYGFL